MTWVLFPIMATLAGGASLAAESRHLLLHDPSISSSQIAFTFAGNIWSAARDGTHLRQLTRGGHEAKPVFSPDGSEITFVDDVDGTRAVYVMAASGGPARRLTYHPADLGAGAAGSVTIPDVLLWAPDGKSIVFNSRRAAFARHNEQPVNVELFRIPANGGFVERMALGRAVQAAISADGARIAYVPNVRLHANWKHYRGGATTRIVIANLADGRIEAEIPRENSNDFNPLWVGDEVYFLSDRDGPVTLFGFDTRSGKVRRIVPNGDFDLQSAAACADAIIYEQFGSLHVVDLKSGLSKQIAVHPAADPESLLPHLKSVDPGDIKIADLSPSGLEAIFAAHGDVFVVSTETGVARDITQTPGAVERDPVLSPEGKVVAYFSDQSGEYELHVRSLRGNGNVSRIKLADRPTFYYSPVWSPDSRKIAYTDKDLNYWYVDTVTRKPVLLDTDLYAGPGHVAAMSWSPDGRAIAYTKQLPNHLHAAFVFFLDENKSRRLTDGMSDVLYPIFDAGGKTLFFTASTDVAFAASPDDMTSLQRPVTRRLYAVELDHRALHALPIAEGNYYGLARGDDKTLFVMEGPMVDPLPDRINGDLRPAPTRILKIELNTGATQEILRDVVSFPGDRYSPSVHFTADGMHLIFARGNQWFFTSVLASSTPRPIDLSHVSVRVDPRAEWTHMFEQAWRDERDFFYDPNLHGVDLKAVKERYAPFLTDLTTREDLNVLLNEMLGNLTVGHLSVSGGDLPAPSGDDQTGLLGADFGVAGGRYQFKHLYSGDPWEPQTRGPLDGVDVREGDYLLAVNGRDVASTADVYRFFIGTAGKETTLTVASSADGSGRHDIKVVPVSDETTLRNFAWVEGNRRTVGELSGGRIAYVYVPDTSAGGYAAFNRGYFAQVDKRAIIVDARYNSGGIEADYLIDALRRERSSYWHLRAGEDLPNPQESIAGPAAMLVNEMTTSGGELFAWMFRHSKLGPLIGARTFGELVGMYTTPDDLLDGGSLPTPNFAFFSRDDDWEIENHGVDPDITVDQDTAAAGIDRDLQLEHAVSVVMDRLRESPPLQMPRHPPFPEYSRKKRQ